MKRILLFIAFIFVVVAPASAQIIPVAGCVANASAGCTWANFAGQSASVGDYVYYYAFKTSTTAPTAPTFQSASMTNLDTASASTSSFRSGCAVLTSTTPAVITATNATRIFVLILHNTAATTTANCVSAGVGFHTSSGTSGTTGTYTFTGGTLTHTDGSSFIIGAVGSSVAPCTPTSLTLRSGNSSTDIFDNDVNKVSTFTTTTCSGTSGNWKTDTVEILAPVCGNTALGSSGFSCVQVQVAAVSAGDSQTVTFANGYTKGDTLMVFVGGGTRDWAGPTGYIANTAGYTWVLWGHCTLNTFLGFYYTVVPATTASSDTITLTSNGTYVSVMALDYKGVGPIDGAGTCGGSSSPSTTPSTGNYTVTVGDLNLGFTGVQGGSLVNGSGWTARATDDIGGYIMTEDQIAASTTANATWTAASGTFDTLGVAFKIPSTSFVPRRR